MSRTAKVLTKAIVAVTFFLYAKLLTDILYSDYKSLTGIEVLVKILCQVLFIIILFVIYHLLQRNSEVIRKSQWFILYGFVVYLFVMQLVIGNRLRVEPMYDFSAVYHGAVEWLVTGSFSEFYDYFYYYPNNLGALSFLTILFRIAANAGCGDFYFIGMLINSLLNAVMIICTFFLCKNIFSPVEAVFSLLIFSLCPPMYFLAPVFYTDQLTMVFPVLIFLLYLHYQKAKEEFLKKELLAFAVAAAAYLGFFLKPTVLITLISIILTMLLQKDYKNLFRLSCNVAVVFVFMTVITNMYFYSRHLNKEVAAEKNTPPEVWIYMGLNDNPGFSPEDTEFARGILNPQMRKKIIKEKIAERIREYGFVGMYRHLNKKEITVFSDGTFELSYTFLFGFVRETKWKEVLTTLGKYYKYYWAFCSLLWYLILLLSVVYECYLCFVLFCGKNKKTKGALSKTDIYRIKLFPVVLSLLGLYIFFLIWEIHPRYMVNYYGFFVILAVAGMKELQSAVGKKEQGKRKMYESVSIS